MEKQTNPNTEPQFLTIREVARLGILPEHALRVGVKVGTVPHFRAGSRYYVNLPRLLEQLDGNFGGDREQ